MRKSATSPSPLTAPRSSPTTRPHARSCQPRHPPGEQRPRRQRILQRKSGSNRRITTPTRHHLRRHETPEPWPQHRPTRSRSNCFVRWKNCRTLIVTISPQPDPCYETNLERIRGSICRAFPLWLRWLLSAVGFTAMTLLGWNSIRFLNMKDGRWVPDGVYGPSDGDKTVVFMVLWGVVAIYSWTRVLSLFLYRSPKS